MTPRAKPSPLPCSRRRAPPAAVLEATLDPVSDTDGALSGQSIHRISTLGDVVRAINFAAGNRGNIVADLTEESR